MFPGAPSLISPSALSFVTFSSSTQTLALDVSGLNLVEGSLETCPQEVKDKIRFKEGGFSVLEIDASSEEALRVSLSYVLWLIWLSLESPLPPTAQVSLAGLGMTSPPFAVSVFCENYLGGMALGHVGPVRGWGPGVKVLVWRNSMHFG